MACDWPASATNALQGDAGAGSKLPSHGRGHWFDPSTAHHKSSTYSSDHQKVRPHQPCVISFQNNFTHVFSAQHRSVLIPPYSGLVLHFGGTDDLLGHFFLFDDFI